MAPKLNKTDARQGSRGRPILIVMLVAIVLVVVGYVLIGGIGAWTSPDGSLEQSETVGGAEPTPDTTSGETVTPDEANAEPSQGVEVPQ